MAVYKKIGFVNSKQIMKDALKGGYAVPAYNFVTLEQAEAILRACIESRSPVILQVSKRAREYFNPSILRHIFRGRMDFVQSSGKPIPVVMHFDHGEALEECIAAIYDGYSSVMIDGSALPLDQNIAVTAEVSRYAHKHDVSVEGELGALAGTEEDTTRELSLFTDPEQVEAFVKRSGVDSLAVSAGNMHGLTKAIAQEGKLTPGLRFDLIDEIARRLPEFPLVLHGASSVLSGYVEQINRYGGSVQKAVGIPEEQLKRVAQGAVCKINIASDGYLVMTASVRKILAEQPGTIDPRKYLGVARDELIKMYMEKNDRIFGSAGRVK